MLLLCHVGHAHTPVSRAHGGLRQSREYLYAPPNPEVCVMFFFSWLSSHPYVPLLFISFLFRRESTQSLNSQDKHFIVLQCKNEVTVNGTLNGTNHGSL